MVKQQKEKGYSIEWAVSAKNSFFKSVEYISSSSLQGASSVISAVSKALEKAAANPEVYSPDKWKVNNNGLYRAFEVKNFRVVYKIISSKKIIKVIKFRHVRQYPLSY